MKIKPIFIFLFYSILVIDNSYAENEFKKLGKSLLKALVETEKPAEQNDLHPKN